MNLIVPDGLFFGSFVAIAMFSISVEYGTITTKFE